MPAPEGIFPLRHILHADLDAFYAAVEQLDNPELRGKQVLVGGPPESRGVVATASYEARRFGAHSAMPMSVALRLCPEGIIVRPRFDRYKEFSGLVMDIFHDLTGQVEPLSLDEAYLDITSVVAEGRDPREVAIELKGRVQAETSLTLSVGVATNKSVAKIASDMDKPDGLVVVSPGEERAFLGRSARREVVGDRPKDGGTAETGRRRGHRANGESTAGLVRPTLRQARQQHQGQSIGPGPRAGADGAANQVCVGGDYLRCGHRRPRAGVRRAGPASRQCDPPPGAQGTPEQDGDCEAPPGGLYHIHPAAHPARTNSLRCRYQGDGLAADVP